MSTSSLTLTLRSLYSFVVPAIVMSLTALHGQVLSASTAVTSDSSAITTGTEVLGIQVYGNNTLSNGVVLDWQYNPDYTSTVHWTLNGSGGSANTGSTGLSAQFDRALNQSIEGGSYLNISLVGLTPGAVYVDQLFAAMTDAGTFADSNITTHSTTETVTDVTPGGDDASTTLEYGQGYGNSTGAYSVTDTFTAPSTGIEMLTITGASNDPVLVDGVPQYYNNGTPEYYSANLLTAFQIRELPEPSTCAMMLAGLVFLGFRIRRKSV